MRFIKEFFYREMVLIYRMGEGEYVVREKFKLFNENFKILNMKRILKIRKRIDFKYERILKIRKRVLLVIGSFEEKGEECFKKKVP